MIELSKSQKTGIKIFDNWHRKDYRHQPILRLGGIAGSGKSTLLQYLVDAYKLNTSNTMFMAYTGKAVDVLRRKGIPAKTCHSSLLEVRESAILDDRGNPILVGGKPKMKPYYRPIDILPAGIERIIIDEASFLPDWLQELALRHNVPILELGDPEQLPPVGGDQCFNIDNIDYVMMDPMRYLKDSELYRLSKAIRERLPINYREYGRDIKFIKRQSTIEKTFEINRELFQYSDINITVTNKNRQAINDLFRRDIIGVRDRLFPVRGEKMICRNNNWNLELDGYPLINGTIGYIESTVSRSNINTKAGIYDIDFRPEYLEEHYFDNIPCSISHLSLPVYEKAEYNPYDEGNRFEYAYAISTHLSQGSEYDTVLFVDSYIPKEDYMRRLKYTAVTRAKERLYYITA